MRQKSVPEKQPAEDVIKDIRRATRRHFSAEDKSFHTRAPHRRFCATVYSGNGLPFVSGRNGAAMMPTT